MLGKRREAECRECCRERRAVNAVRKAAGLTQLPTPSAPAGQVPAEAAETAS